MEPQIRYCTSADGVSIAYSTWGAGSGKPHLIRIGAFPFADLRLWETFTPELHACLVRHWTVTTYDGRGIGRSQRDVSGFSLDAMLRDLAAVIAAVGAARPSLMASGFRAHVGLAYAADHPDGVERLIIDNGGETSMPRAGVDGFLALAATDWDLFLDAFASRSMSWAGAKSKEFADVMRANVTPEVALAYYQASRSVDVYDRLPFIKAPTLILLPNPTNRPQSAVQRFVSAIPNAVLVSMDTDALWLPEDECVAAIDDFIGSTGDRSAPETMASGTAIILFTDIADSTALTERMGDAAFRAPSRELEEHIRAAMREHGGTPVDGKVLGDGVMGVFTSASQAIDAAQRCVAISADSELRLHIGLHAGDVIREKDNVYGGAVNIASRICGLSEPGEILVSATIRELARTSAGVTFEDRGEHPLKGIEDPVRVFAVRAVK